MKDKRGKEGREIFIDWIRWRINSLEVGLNEEFKGLQVLEGKNIIRE